MGVPVITLRGDVHSARVGASILTRVGLTEMIAEDPDQYVQIGMDLAKDLDRLAQLRAGMRKRMRHSLLCEAKSFTRDMEDVFRKVWQNWCRTDSDLK
jgi:predicted O-linked N-acetylglucosamine transferase (SPINDLY family)